MVRQHPAADGDRPHYYSQYWLNVALGKPTETEPAVATSSAAAATAAAVEPDMELELPPPPAPAARPEPVKPAKKAPEKKQEPARLSSLADLANIEELMKSSQAMPDDVVPDIEAESALAEPAIVTNFDLSEAPVAEVEEDEGIEPFDENGEFDFDEEEEEDEWGGRRPGKGPKKPTKPQKPPRRREF